MRRREANLVSQLNCRRFAIYPWFGILLAISSLLGQKNLAPPKSREGSTMFSGASLFRPFLFFPRAPSQNSRCRCILSPENRLDLFDVRDHSVLVDLHSALDGTSSKSFRVPVRVQRRTDTSTEGWVTLHERHEGSCHVGKQR